MKFLLEFVVCCGSSPSSEIRRQPDDARLLVAEEPRRRKHDRKRGGGHEWRPSLSSISEEILTAGKINNGRRPAAEGWQRSLKRKVASMSQRDHHRSSAHDDYRAHAMPSFLPAPFMF